MEGQEQDSFPLKQYLEIIGIPQETSFQPTVETLYKVIHHQVKAIPCANLFWCVKDEKSYNPRP